MNNLDNPKSNTAQREEEVLKFWDEKQMFEKSLQKDSPKGEFIFYDGPPFATGTPHYGHIVGSAVKDVVGRYKTMQGYHVPRRWGWDCHGLPIENIAEKGLGISGRDKIEEIGIDKFNQYARDQVLGFVDDWRDVVIRMGRWVDFDGSYKTMDNTFIESVWWALKKIHEKGLLYEGERVLPFCPRCETPISNSEIAMDNSYKDIKDISAYVKFKLKNEPNTYFLAWTTTPWTLPGNMALAINPDVPYAKVKVKEETYIVASDLIGKIFAGNLFENKKDFEVIDEIPGTKLVGLEYLPPFNYYTSDSSIKNFENGWKVYAAEFVTTTEGTGIVHIAAFGEDDMVLAKSAKLPVIKHVTTTGEFTDKVIDFAGKKVKPKGDHQSGDIEIIKYLAHNNLLFAKLKIDHSYPHCYRCDTPLIYYSIPAWFINIQDVKPKFIELNKKINWVPDHLKYGRFHNILESAPDWNISRNRYWASPLPIWKCTCGEYKVIGSVAELQSLANETVPNINEMDLHRPYIDNYTITCEKCNSKVNRIPEVFDCWFESGAMPFASQHYPFENADKFDPEKNLGFPGDFIAEYIPQTRTWFYYMLALSSMIFEETSFLNVVTTGTVLASDGRKMSKSLKNYPDPKGIFNTYGVDALRLYLLGTPLMRGEDIQFNDKEVGDASNKTLGRLVNLFELYSLYKDQTNHIPSIKSQNHLDRWIIAKTLQLHFEVTKAMEGYELDKATRRFADFVDDLSTWYIRRSRNRIKDGDKDCLATTLWVLREFSKLIAPFAPFHADWVWTRVRSNTDEESVHLANWSEIKEFDDSIIEEMEIIRNLISKALDLRKIKNIPVRQPLAKVKFKTKELDISYIEIICEELNVKEVEFDENLSDEVEFDTNLTQELIDEGILRNILRAIQDARKNASLKVGQVATANITLSQDELIVFNKNLEKISQQTNIEKFDTHLGELKVSITKIL